MMLAAMCYFARNTLVITHLAWLTNVQAQFARESTETDGPGVSHREGGAADEPNDLLNAMLVDFNPRVRPLHGGLPVRVRCGLHVVSLSSINEINMDYKLDIFLRQMWEDPRLNFSSHVDKGSDPLLVPYRLIEQLWQPPIHLPNELMAQLHVIPMPSISYKIFPNGTVFYSVRVTLTLACPMNLASFPMDKQECHMKMESFSMLTKDLLLEWQPNPIHLSENLQLPQFQLSGVSTAMGVQHYKLGQYSSLTASFYLDRQYGFFVLQTYTPTVLIVVLSWVSFWISMDAIPARISLGVTTVLTMATQLSGSKASIPRVSYPKAIDIWMSTCMAFVFAALLEYAFVNALSKTDDDIVPDNDPSAENTSLVDPPTTRSKADNHKNEGGCDCVRPRPCGNNLSTEQERPDGEFEIGTVQKWAARSRRTNQVFCGIRHRDLGRCIDRISRALFPGLFLVFNVLYWTVYTRSSY